MEGLKNRTILVTGGTGFVGSHLVSELVKKGARVVVPYRSIDPSSYFVRLGMDKKVILVAADLKDQKRVVDIISKYEIRDIFHLAAQPLVDIAYHNPVETIETNVMGTAHILHAAWMSGTVERIIHTSSDKAYGKLVAGPAAGFPPRPPTEGTPAGGGPPARVTRNHVATEAYTEDHPLGGDHPYEVSKAAADLVVRAFVNTYGAPVVTVRFGNIYGPGDLNMSRIIPSIVRSALTGEPVRLRSDGTFVRDYVYIKDVIRAYLFLLEGVESKRGAEYNISSNVSLSVIDLIQRVEKILGKKITYTVENSQKNEIPYQHLDWSKIKKIGWNPEYTLETGIKETLEWYRSKNI